MLNLYTYYIVRKLQNCQLELVEGPYPFAEDVKRIIEDYYGGESDIHIFEHTAKGRLYGDRIGDE
jgi:hypothetical protein